MKDALPREAGAHELPGGRICLGEWGGESRVCLRRLGVGRDYGILIDISESA